MSDLQTTQGFGMEAEKSKLKLMLLGGTGCAKTVDQSPTARSDRQLRVNMGRKSGGRCGVA